MEGDDFDQELEEDNLEEEMDKVQKSKVAKPKAQKSDTTEEGEEVAEQTYEIFHQPERTGIKDTRTGEVVAEGFDKENVGVLMALEKIMNQQEKISIASGAQ